PQVDDGAVRDRAGRHASEHDRAHAVGLVEGPRGAVGADVAADDDRSEQVVVRHGPRLPSARGAPRSGAPPGRRLALAPARGAVRPGVAPPARATGPLTLSGWTPSSSRHGRTETVTTPAGSVCHRTSRPRCSACEGTASDPSCTW